jgi:hypothetical protein
MCRAVILPISSSESRVWPVGAAASVGDSASGWCVPMWSHSASTSENPLEAKFGVCAFHALR